MNKEKKALTLVELIISIFISSLVLIFVFAYVGDTIRAITYSVNVSQIITDYDDFISKINNYKKIYDKNLLIIDEVQGTGNDILLLTNENESSGVIFGVVNSQSNKLEDNVLYPIYADKSIGYRELSSQEIIDVKADGNIAYGYDFFEDKIFRKIKLKDFQVTMYNSGALVDVVMYINLDFYSDLEGSNYIDVSDEFIEKFNLNF